MAYKISGVMTHDGRVIVIRKDNYTIESNTLVSGTAGAGGYFNYEVTDLEDTEKIAIGRRNTDGWVIPQKIGSNALILELPSKAVISSPGNGTSDQDVDVNIVWSDGGGATSYDVYFGTDPTPDASEFKGNQPGTSYEPGTLQADITHYWRIDAKNDGGTTTGDVWSFTTAIVNDLYIWGHNSLGTLGLGDLVNRSFPAQSGFDKGISQMSGGAFYTMIVTGDGELWGFGNGEKGQLGNEANGVGARRTSPVQIGSLTDWSKVICAQRSTYGIKTDGTLWSWGDNYYGQLGQNNTTNYSSPVQVGVATNWGDIMAGNVFVYALTTTNSLYACGRNVYGQLGKNNITNYSSLTLVGSGYSKMAAGRNHGILLKTNNTLWAVGFNSEGQLGQGDITHRSSPVQVAGTWDNIACSLGASYASKSAGSLWSWGSAGYGMLGLNNSTNYSTPQQIGSLTDWGVPVSHAQSAHTGSVKTDGSLWVWGNNVNYELGNGYTSNESSPIQVGVATDWDLIITGNNYTAGLRS